MTLLQAVNQVLQKLREATVTAILDPYPSLIKIFVNEAKRDVEDAWNWSSLRSTINVALAAADLDNVYSLTGTSQRTRILDVYCSTKKSHLAKIDHRYLRMLMENIPTQTGAPTFYCVTGTDSNDALEITTWPLADDDYTLDVYTVNPQADLSADSDAITVPTDPIIQGAYLRAIIERGEDAGTMSETQEGVYRYSLATAVSQDAQHHTDEITWQVV